VKNCGKTYTGIGENQKLEYNNIPRFALSDSRGTDLININCQRRTVRKTIPITACCAHIKVPWLAASCQKANLPHKAHDPAEKLEKISGVSRTFSLANFARHLTINTHTQAPKIAVSRGHTWFSENHRYSVLIQSKFRQNLGIPKNLSAALAGLDSS